MIPSKMEKLRKTYTPRVKMLLEQIKNALEPVELPSTHLNTWELIIEVPGILTSEEIALVRGELNEAGWGMTTRYVSNESEKIVIYCK